MELLGKPFNEIDWAALEQAREQQVEESRTLDFKRDAPDLNSRESKRAFLDDVCCFANLYGGILLYGVEEARAAHAKLGHIAALPGIPPLPDDFTPRVQELIRSSFDPRFSAVSLRVIESGTGMRILMVGVERSPQAPHRVISNGPPEFMRRTLTSCEKMDAYEIREAMRRSLDASQSARERILKLADAASGIRFTAAKVTLWGCAVPAFEMTLPEAMGGEVVKDALWNLRTLHPFPGVEVQYDHLGAFLSPSTERTPVLNRLHADGTVEHFAFADINASPLEENPPRYLNHGQLLAGLERLGQAIPSLRQSVGVGGTMVAAIGLFGADGLYLHQIYGAPTGGPIAEPPIPTKIGTDVVLLSPRETSDEFFGRVVSAAAHLFWNAGGHPLCGGFDTEGRRTPGINPV